MGQHKRQALSRQDAQRRAIRLGQLLAERIDVFCWCNRCGHNSVLATERLIGELGPSFPVPDVGGRLRCSGCGSKDVAARPDWPSVGQIARHT